MTEEEKNEIVERVSRNMLKIALEVGWYLLELSQDEFGGIHNAPRYEEIIREEG